MYSIVKSFHSYFALVVFGLLIAGVILCVLSFLGKKRLSASGANILKFGLIGAHTQLLIGILLYFLSPYGFENLSGETMKDSYSRLLAVEHPFTNILALVLITIGYRKIKQHIDTYQAGKYGLIYFGIGLILLLSRVPWQTWFKQ